MTSTQIVHSLRRVGLFVGFGVLCAVAQSAPLGAQESKAVGQQAVAAAPSAAKVTREYIVGPNDVLSVVVVDQPTLTNKYIVREDGTFTFPMLGRLQAGGLSLQVVENDIRDRLAKGYLRDPQIAVSVDQFRSQQIFVMGEVRSPGSLQFTGSMSLIEALARAGSVTERAGTEALIVRQTTDGVPLNKEALEARAKLNGDAGVIHVSLQTLQAGGTLEGATLRSGDTIFVPRAELIFVSGQVRGPGEYPLRPNMTVRQALALAGGITERGSVRRIQIIRKVNGADTTIGVELQDEVKASDTVVVRERLF